MPAGWPRARTSESTPHNPGRNPQKMQPTPSRLAVSADTRRDQGTGIDQRGKPGSGENAAKPRQTGKERRLSDGADG